MLCMSVIIQHLLTRILTRLACRDNVKIVRYIKQYFTAVKAQGNCVIAAVICYWKMTSFMALDDLTSFLRLKDVTNTCKRMRRGLSIGGSSSVQRRKVGKKLKTQICFRHLLCNKFETDQLQCVICCVVGNYDRIISDALENGTEKTQGI